MKMNLQPHIFFLTLKKSLLSQSGFFLMFFTRLKESSKRLFFLRVRLLPVVIFCSGLLLTVKVSVLWKTLHPDEEIWGFAESYAEKPAEKPAEKKKDSTKNLKVKEKAPHPGKEDFSSTPEPAQNVDVAGIDPSVLTREQFKVLLDLSKRQKELEKQDKKIPREEATLSVIEQQIKEHTSELQKTKKRLEELLNQVEEKENDNTARLVKMAESMKPKEAAKILETLDFNVLLEIMEKIKPKSGSAILSGMDPVKAGYLMTELAKRRKLIKRENTKKST